MTTTRMPLEGIEAKAILQKLGSTGVGEIIELPPLLLGIPGVNTEAIVVTADDKKTDYLLSLSFLGVRFCAVHVSTKAKELVMEVQK